MMRAPFDCVAVTYVVCLTPFYLQDWLCRLVMAALYCAWPEIWVPWQFSRVKMLRYLLERFERGGDRGECRCLN
jgi:hypothetical protein